VLPQDHDPRWLPDPIPASFYARGEAPPWVGWASAARGLPMPSRRVLAIGGVALAGVVLIGALVRLADRGASPTAAHVAQAPPSPAATQPGSQPTPFAAAPTDTPTPTPTPTATPSPTPTPTATPTSTMTPVTIETPQIRASQGGRATLVATTSPRITCTIAVGYTPPPQLGAATSTGSGTVSWTWRVSGQVQPGIYQILVTCGSGSAGATITVT
jgi:hypothetical protein